ncbi:WXG100 family type VII secretion target [Pseudonocardiaceae bacterium YIM PH 21723]|nr:WXG100 family type VII secretion target [Pseudonocardiaceae bacterium YIM PH 21723]
MGENLSAHEIYDKIRNGPGAGTLAAAQQAANDLKALHGQIEQRISQLVSKMESAWEGDASQNTATGAKPLALALQLSQPKLNTAQDLLGRQAGSFQDAFNGVHPVEDKAPENNFLNRMTPGTTELDSKIDKYKADSENNVRVYNTYSGASNYNGTGMPTNYPDIKMDQSAIEIDPAKSPGTGSGTGTGTGGGSTGSRSGGGGHVGSVDVGSGTGGTSNGAADRPGTYTPPPDTHIGQSGTGGSTGTGGAGGTGGGGNLPGQSGGGQLPGQGGVVGVPGGRVPGGTSGGKVGAGGKVAAGTGSGGAGAKGGGGAVGAKGGGAGGGKVGGIGGGGSVGAGSGGGLGKGAGAFGVEPEGGTRAGAAGRPGAAGQSGMGGMGGAGARGSKSEDEEHETASYLQNDYLDEIVGDLPPTAPPVIGG